MFGDGVDVKFVENTMHSFLLVGQSNMAGRGDLGEVPPIRNRFCHMLRMGRWQPMSEPINPDRSITDGKFKSGIGLSASFADEFSKKYYAPVGLIPCADGGTRIDEWESGSLLFDHAIMMTKLATRTSKLSGILWHQGESECRSDELVNSYADKLFRLVECFRSQLGGDDVPFIFGELSEDIDDSWGLGKNVARMNGIFKELSQQIKCSALVSVKGLGLKPDGIHFTSASYRELGIRYFNAYDRLISKK